MTRVYQRSVLGASLWMIAVTGLLAWLPFIGPFLGGVVGGRHAGSVGRALLAVAVTIGVAGAFVCVLGVALTSWPLVGALAGLGASAILVAHAGPLVLGSVVGGLVARS